MGNFIFIDKNISNKKILFMYLEFFILSSFLVLTLEFAIFGFSVRSLLSWLENNISLFFISTIVVMAFMVLIFSISRRFLLSNFIGVSFFLVFALVMLLKIRYSNEPLFFYDLVKIISPNIYIETFNIIQLVLLALAGVLFLVGIYVIIRNGDKILINKYLLIYSTLISLYIIEGFFSYQQEPKVVGTIAIVVSFVITFYFVKVIIEGVKINTKSDKIKKVSFYNTFVLILSICINIFIVINYNNNIISMAIEQNSKYPKGEENYINFKEDSVITAFSITSSFEPK